MSAITPGASVLNLQSKTAARLELKDVLVDVETFHLAEVCEDADNDQTCLGAERFVAPLSFKTTDFDLIALRQAVADIVVLTVTSPAAELEMTLTNDDGAIRTFKLKPVKGEIDLLLANITPVMRGPLRSEVMHFDLYYRLADSFGRSLEFARPRIGVRGQWVKAVDVQPVLPDILRVVSVRPDAPIGGGVSRPVCTTMLFDLP
jgi:hypothetical protein